MSQPIYIAGYHQSSFGKLFGMSIPQIIRSAVQGVCSEVGIVAEALDVGSVGAACNLSLNGQGLVAGLLAAVPGLGGKPIEAVENACASGGQAILSVIQKLQLGMGEVGISLGFEKMRDAEGRMDAELIGRVLGYFSHPDDRQGKTYVFPHLFAEVMDCYMRTYGVTEGELAHIALTEYANARHNPYAQMRAAQIDNDEFLNPAGRNRYLIEGLPLKIYDCSQITDGYAALVLATRRGLEKLGLDPRRCVEVAGFGQATDPLSKQGRNVLRPAGAYRAMHQAYTMAGLAPDEANVAEVHDCFTVMGAIGTEVIGKSAPGGGARYWAEGHANVDGPCAINTSGGLIAKGHPVGATGIAMVGWCAWQLLGKAPKPLQVRAPRAAVTFNIGGPLCASVCTVLKAPVHGA